MIQGAAGQTYHYAEIIKQAKLRLKLLGFFEGELTANLMLMVSTGSFDFKKAQDEQKPGYRIKTPCRFILKTP